MGVGPFPRVLELLNGLLNIFRDDEHRIILAQVLDVAESSFLTHRCPKIGSNGFKIVIWFDMMLHDVTYIIYSVKGKELDSKVCTHMQSLVRKHVCNEVVNKWLITYYFACVSTC